MECLCGLQLVKQTRGNFNATKAKAWQLFYMTAATMPPSKEFTSMVSGAWAARLGALLSSVAG
jgi:hypothetical protein